MPKMAIIRGGRVVRDWEEEYRKSILLERELGSRTMFRAIFDPSSPNPNNPQTPNNSQTPNNPQTLAITFTDGSFSAYSLPCCICASHQSADPDEPRVMEWAADLNEEVESEWIRKQNKLQRREIVRDLVDLLA